MLSRRDIILTKLQILTDRVPCIKFRYFKSLRVETENQPDTSSLWRRELLNKGFTIESRLDDYQLANDPHMPAYQVTVKFKQNDANFGVKMKFGIIVVLGVLEADREM